ncbi:uncharacterized protein MELLADRAFT_101014 [Melampsora larici-populina 98AG31]|uniref:J domain-containing protein n=1 Tax=Melampsora larici-populina (strain 98AG31 / pathotype 3-4-7) TaxID=747676 RepID=F4R3C0_MELLP|nr:uncharacterized protein MELLADRAFT_101014 [Melampsora larici-populina 98AG31]EGG13195.1 hypothetical protein MELLADRAFT_101014 [Melampsora larici-populina 98AG31]
MDFPHLPGQYPMDPPEIECTTSLDPDTSSSSTRSSDTTDAAWIGQVHQMTWDILISTLDYEQAINLLHTARARITSREEAKNHQELIDVAANIRTAVTKFEVAYNQGHWVQAILILDRLCCYLTTMVNPLDYKSFELPFEWLIKRGEAEVLCNRRGAARLTLERMRSLADSVWSVQACVWLSGLIDYANGDIEAAYEKFEDITHSQPLSGAVKHTYERVKNVKNRLELIFGQVAVDDPHKIDDILFAIENFLTYTSGEKAETVYRVNVRLVLADFYTRAMAKLKIYNDNQSAQHLTSREPAYYRLKAMGALNHILAIDLDFDFEHRHLFDHERRRHLIRALALRITICVSHTNVHRYLELAFSDYQQLLVLLKEGWGDGEVSIHPERVYAEYLQLCLANQHFSKPDPNPSCSAPLEEEQCSDTPGEGQSSDTPEDSAEQLEDSVDSLGYYKILGVDKSASNDEIRRAYLKSSRRMHPDRQGGDTALFQHMRMPGTSTIPAMNFKALVFSVILEMSCYPYCISKKFIFN